MPCHVSYLNTDGQLKCQFQHTYNIFTEDSLYDFDGKQWCLLHLPVQNKLGDKSIKYKLEKNLEHFFTSYITRVFKESHDTDTEIDFSYTVFPENIPIFSPNNDKFLNKNKLVFRCCEFFGNVSLSKPSNMRDNVELQLIDFINAKFYKYIYFHGYNILSFSFDNSEFYENVYIHSCNITECSFKKITFYKGASFSDSSFEEGIFDDICFFDNTTFNEMAIFKNVKFKTKMSFQHVKFKKKLDFSWPCLDKDDRSFEKISFENSEFQVADFTNRVFLYGVNFSGCVFHKPPKFHGAKLHQNTIFPSQKNFKDITSYDAEHCYRTLYMAMGELKASNEEGMFYALMQKSMRKSNRHSLFNKIISWLYGATTDYGQSISRPLGLLFGMVIVFSLLYMLFVTPTINFHNGIDWQIVGSSLDFSLQQIVRPFSSYSDIANPLIKNFYQMQPVKFRIVAFFNSLCALILIPLFLLAVRWKFKRD